MLRLAIIGTAGIPGRYGGFETLAEQLARQLSSKFSITVYCPKQRGVIGPKSFGGADLVYIPFKANGLQSIIYDVVGLISAARNFDVILLLGVSGAIALPFIRLLSSVKLIVNIDGMEWRREKWNWLARFILKSSESIACRFSHLIVADNEVLVEYVSQQYEKNATLIEYGGDQGRARLMTPPAFKLPDFHALALCRIEPENNVHIIVEAFANLPDFPLVFVGNWSSSDYGNSIRSLYAEHSHLHLLDPVYDMEIVAYLRDHAACYIHGHSAGGTNPSLVEAMWYRAPSFCYDVSYNRRTTENMAIYWRDGAELEKIVRNYQSGQYSGVGDALVSIAQRRYSWELVAEKYARIIK
jgi:glycosyltransferase involved in cell wall biosynthesis